MTWFLHPRVTQRRPEQTVLANEDLSVVTVSFLEYATEETYIGQRKMKFKTQI